MATGPHRPPDSRPLHVQSMFTNAKNYGQFWNRISGSPLVHDARPFLVESYTCEFIRLRGTNSWNQHTMQRYGYRSREPRKNECDQGRLSVLLFERDCAIRREKSRCHTMSSLFCATSFRRRGCSPDDTTSLAFKSQAVSKENFRKIEKCDISRPRRRERTK